MAVVKFDKEAIKMSEFECLVSPETARKTLIKRFRISQNQWTEEGIAMETAKHTARALIRIAEGEEIQDFWELYQDERLKDGLEPISLLPLE